MSNVNRAAFYCYCCAVVVYFAAFALSLGTEPSIKSDGRPSTESAKGLTYMEDASLRAFRIEMAKKEILRKLGMKTRPPQMHDLKSNVPKPVFDGEISSLFSDSTDPAKTTKIVVPSEEGNRNGCRSDAGCFSFHLTDRVFKNQMIEFATLQIYKDPASSMVNMQKIRLEVLNGKGKLIAKRRVPIAHDWISFTVKDQIEQWTEGQSYVKDIHTFKITCENCRSPADFQVSTKPRYRPFLLIRISERKNVLKRKRRSFSVECIPGYDKCCRQSLYVSFKEIGWHDWIIEPAGFDVNFCEGRCSGSTIMVAKSHGFVKKELMRYKKNNFLSVCCVPTKFGMLTLLHFDEDGFIFKTTLENMVVKECGCL